jgi:hypothetical protein
MKSLSVVICLSLLLVLPGCPSIMQMPSSSSSITGPETEDPPVSSSAANEPKQDLPVPSSSETTDPWEDYFVTDRRTDGITDREAVEALCNFLLENLSLDQYCAVSVYPGATHPVKTYVVLLFAPDKTVAEKILEDYSGPWAPVLYENCRFSLAELTQAEADIRRFIEDHPEIIVENITRDPFEDSVKILVRQPFEELTGFVEKYPMKSIFWISEQDIRLSNPD